MKNSKYQNIIYKVFQETKKDINISAVAGSGKTTVLLELLKFIPRNSLALFLAFNNSIVDELKNRSAREDVKISTLHSLGWHLILANYGSKVKMNANKGLAKTEKVLKELKIDEKKKGYYFYNVPRILDLMRCNLCSNNEESIVRLIDYYDFNIEQEDIKIIIKAYEYLVKDKSQFDFMDMIFVPVVDRLIRFKKYDYVFCDESQDFSLCQQEFIKKCISRKGRLITVGDKRQAIYGFAGADANSYDRLANVNGQAIRLPLSVCYRCGKKIVNEAKKYVKEIEYYSDSPEGDVHYGNLTEIKEGDWIICRNLKPLVQAYIWLMKNKIKSRIRGKDLGEGILLLLKKMKANNFDTLYKNLDREKERLFDKLKKRGFKKPSLHPKMETLEQKIEILKFLSEEVSNVKELDDMIKNMFSDKIIGITLSTIHKSKGLENERIFFLLPELIPSKYATQPWQLEQENNLAYVAITRAKKELIYVRTNDFISDLCNKVTLTKQ